jgi:hypothetical protein
MPTWVKVAFDAWTTAAAIADGPVFRSVNRGGQIRDTGLSEKVVWQLIRPYAEAAGWPESRPTIVAAPARSCAEQRAGNWNRSKCSWATLQSRRLNATWGRSRIWCMRRMTGSSCGWRCSANIFRMRGEPIPDRSRVGTYPPTPPRTPSSESQHRLDRRLNPRTSPNLTTWTIATSAPRGRWSAVA